jgi:hypothetical protein
MICLEVQVNEGPRVVAGAASAESITTSVGIYPGIPAAWVRVTGDVYPDHEPIAEAHWLNSPLNVGDTLIVRVVDSDNPTPPTLSRTDPSVATSDSVPLVCAFCAKSHEESQKMIASPKAVICDECIRLHYQTLVDEGFGSAPVSA